MIKYSGLDDKDEFRHTFIMKMYTPRHKPQVGDRKMIKGAAHIRQLVTVLDPQTGKLSYVTRHGKQCFEWVKV